MNACAIDELEALSIIQSFSDIRITEDDEQALPLFRVAFWLDCFLNVLGHHSPRVICGFAKCFREEFPYPYVPFAFHDSAEEEQSAPFLELLQDFFFPDIRHPHWIAPLQQ